MSPQHRTLHGAAGATGTVEFSASELRPPASPPTPDPPHTSDPPRASR